MDFIGPLPPSELDGEVFDQILTVVDLFSSEVVLIPAHTSWTSEEVANAFWKQVVRRVGGFPSHFVSDRDKLFVARFWKELCRLCGIEQNMSSAYHAESDGKTERANRVVGQILRCLIDFHPEQWASKLLPTELAINIAPNATTLKAPLEVSRGYVPPFLPSSALDSSVPHSQLFLDSLRLGWIEATDTILAAQVRQTVHANRHRQDDPEHFDVGSKVYLSTKELRIPEGYARKFVPRFMGPYKITRAFRETSRTPPSTFPFNSLGSTIDSMPLAFAPTTPTTTLSSPPALSLNHLRLTSRVSWSTRSSGYCCTTLRMGNGDFWCDGSGMERSGIRGNRRTSCEGMRGSWWRIICSREGWVHDGRFHERGEECKDRCPSTRLGRRTVGSGELERLKLGSAVGSGNPTVEAQGKQGDRGGARSRSVDSEESTGARDLCRFLLLLYRCSKLRSIQRLCSLHLRLQLSRTTPDLDFRERHAWSLQCLWPTCSR